MRIRKLLGLYGLVTHENALALRCRRYFDRAMVFFAIGLILIGDWGKEHHFRAMLDIGIDWLIWFFLLSESIILTMVVTDKRRYWIGNWMNGVFIILAMPLFLSQLPRLSLHWVLLLILIRLLLPCWDMLTQNRLRATLLVTFAITFLWGSLMPMIDHSFPNPWDGIWWAWQTVTSVGYGDFVPSTDTGRVLGILLMIAGVALTSLLTANFSAYFVGKSANKMRKEEDDIYALLIKINTQLTTIEDRIKKLEQK